MPIMNRQQFSQLKVSQYCLTFFCGYYTAFSIVILGLHMSLQYMNGTRWQFPQKALAEHAEGVQLGMLPSDHRTIFPSANIKHWAGGSKITKI